MEKDKTQNRLAVKYKLKSYIVNACSLIAAKVSCFFAVNVRDPNYVMATICVVAE